jgi:tetratricopeptide (TPR) repeat protein
MSDLHERVQLALRHLGHEEWSEGIAELQSIVRDQPAWAEAWALLVGAHLATGNLTAASAASDRALAVAPDRFLPCLKAGELAMRVGDIERAEPLFLAALRACDPNTADAAAAKRWLVLTRTARRSGIVHGARLPAVDGLRRLLPRFRWNSGPAPLATTVDSESRAT